MGDMLFMPDVYKRQVWNWVRTNILFGVFGVGSYVLAPMLLYIAVLVACERPVKGLSLIHI